jgi:hypothetical protein
MAGFAERLASLNSARGSEASRRCSDQDEQGWVRIRRIGFIVVVED